MIIPGFSYSAARAGVRKQGRLDVGLIYCDGPAVAAGVFTNNLVKAAPVLLDMERIKACQARAILVNSGIANACTGEQGLAAARQTAALAAAALGIPEESVLVASTGVIGEQLDAEKFARVMASLAAGLSPSGYDEVVRAIMTTDTVPKTAAATVAINGREVSLFGMAKGAGMIMPDMATMLCFVMTDARIEAAALQELLRAGVAVSFNRITVDGDTSTNDTVLVLASGRAANPVIGEQDPAALALFKGGLDRVLKDLAMQIVADGEGATKVVTIRVKGATKEQEAEAAARTVANSCLVKTAIFGEDANWGRIMAALGRAGIAFAPERVDIGFDGISVVVNGLGCGSEAEKQATAVLKKSRFAIEIDLKTGPAGCEVYTCDLSLDYVKINADYRS